MPLTAWADANELVDSTQCSDEVWTSVHKVSPRPMLLCPACTERVHAKVSPRGLRFFAHNAKQPHCDLHGETGLHRALKSLVAEIVRRTDGWDAALEVAACPSDHGGWRADVLATRRDGRRRVALEVQLASMTPEEARERVARYARDGVDSLWISTKHAPWVLTIPSVVVLGAVPDYVAGRVEVIRGISRLVSGNWDVQARAPLENVIAGFLRGTAVAYEIGRVHEDVPWGNQIRFTTHENAVAIVPTAHQQEHERLVEERAREREKQLRDAEDHRRNMDALYARQEFLLRVVLGEFNNLESVWLGVPPTHALATSDLLDACGNEKTAHGAVVWTGADRESLDLAAVLSPVASRITPGLAASWRRRGVRIYAVELEEASRLARAVGKDLVTLVRPDRPLTDIRPDLRQRIDRHQHQQSIRSMVRGFLGQR
jgi:hypothetical protein